MSAYFYREVPAYQMSKFCAVRNTLDNLANILNLVEIINTSSHCRVKDERSGFDVAVFSGEYRRILVKKEDGYFSMAIPFQVVDSGEIISFNFDSIGEEVSGRFVSMMRSAIQTLQGNSHSHEDVIISFMENYSLDLQDANRYYDAFASLIAEDHGYFRFDDDINSANGDIHPRYHFDIFFKNNTAIKIGYDRVADVDCFYSLIDSSKPKHYLSLQK